MEERAYTAEHVFLDELVEDLGHVLGLVLTVDNVTIRLRLHLRQCSQLKAKELGGICHNTLSTRARHRNQPNPSAV